jgi:signal transduction histidine kinase
MPVSVACRAGARKPAAPWAVYRLSRTAGRVFDRARVRHAGVVFRRLLASTYGGRAWARLLYALVAGPLSLLGAVYLVVAGVAGSVLAVTIVGVPALAGILLGARAGGAGHRWLARTLLRAPIPPPPPVRAHAGVLNWIGSTLTDATNWRCVAYLVLQVPLGLATSAATVGWWLAGSLLAAYPVWSRSLTYESDGRVYHGTVGIGGLTFDTWPRATLLIVAGALVLLAAPWATRALLWPATRLARVLLGPSRVARLQQARAAVILDATAQLRRIERDLHDGAQAQLVALAMHLDLARHELALGNATTVASLLDTAHREATRAIDELRDLVRGIHTPVLDNGLGPALGTLTARMAIPVDLAIDGQRRASPAIETITYFTASELLTNVARHSRARRAAVSLSTSRPGWLRLTVRDDGIGGARPAGGLAGLATRIHAVGGRMDLASPAGGPTVVVVELPESP